MNDIPLATAQIIWDPDTASLPPVKVVAIRRDDDVRYNAAWGACNDFFVHTDDAGRLALLFRQFNYMTALDGVPPEALHQAFMVIPEYRAALIEFGAIPPEHD